MDPVKDEKLLKGYSNISPIYLRGLQGSYIVFSDNIFDSNIGMHGGAIHIDNIAADPYQEASHFGRYPFVLFENNTFSRNMAYFEGNALYVVGT